MSAVADKSISIDQIKAQLALFIPDIANAPKGEMTLYSSAKNMRFYILNKQKVASADYKKFSQLVDDLKPSVAVFISCMESIPFEVKANPLQFYVDQSDLTPRFIEMLAKQDDVTQAQKDIASVAFAKKKVQTSKIDGYANNEEGFNAYVEETNVSSLEFEKSRKKWEQQMDARGCKTRDAFKEYVQKVQNAKKATPDGTQEQFNEFVKITPLNKITKTSVKNQFGNLPATITFLDEPVKEFSQKIKELKKTLMGN